MRTRNRNLLILGLFLLVNVALLGWYMFGTEVIFPEVTQQEQDQVENGTDVEEFTEAPDPSGDRSELGNAARRSSAGNGEDPDIRKQRKGDSNSDVADREGTSEEGRSGGGSRQDDANQEPTEKDWTERIDEMVNGEYVPGELLVKVPEKRKKKSVKHVLKTLDAERTGEFQKSNGESVLPGWVHLELPDKRSVPEALKLLKKEYGNKKVVSYAEPNFIAETSVEPNDTRFSQQWGFKDSEDDDIDATEAWDRGTDAGAIIVGVVDEGIDYAHEDLNANMWVNSEELNGTDGVDDDNNGYVDDVYGWDWHNDDSDPGDRSENIDHGTHVAGTIGAETDNEIGVAGTAWNVQLMALKFLGGDDGRGSYSDAIKAIDYGIDKGVDVLNNSWGGDSKSSSLKDAVQRARDAGILFPAAAGNDSRDIDSDPFYPASYDVDNVIAVAGTNDDDQLDTNYSNYGDETVHLGAPGSYIWSTIPGNDYSSYTGTSMATPHVSGSAALVWGMHSDLSYTEVKDGLIQEGDPLSSLDGKTISGRRLNLENTLARFADSNNSAPTADFSYSPTNPDPDETVNFTDESSDSDGSISSWSWDFGDGTTSTNQNPSHSYSSGGTYTVTLTVTDDDGAQDTTSQDITVNSAPTADFSYSPSTPTVDETIQFSDESSDSDGSLSSWEWDFYNDGTTDSTNQNPTHSYSSADTYTVTLTVTDDDGLTDSTSQDITVVSGNTVFADNFDDGTLTDKWNVNNISGSGVSGVDTRTSSSGSYSMYTGEGEIATGTDSLDLSSYDVGSVSAWIRRGDDSFSENPESGEDMVVEYLASDGTWNSLASYAGGGTAGEIYTPTLSLPDAAFHSGFKLRFHQLGGSGDTYDYWHVDDVQVTADTSDSTNSSPIADFSFSPSHPDAGETVDFTDQSSDSDGSIDSWSWDFDGDGSEDSTNQNPSYAYSSGGTYTVTLTVTDDDGATDSASQDITVNAPPSASFTYSPTEPHPGDSVDFTDGSSDSDGSIDAYSWDFGDGSTGTSQNPSHTYDSTGSYTVTLTVTDDDGATDSTSQTVDVVANAAPTADFTYSPSSPSVGQTIDFTDGSSDSDGSISSYSWDFGDGSTSSSQNPSHSYDSGGTYTVTLTVTDDDGATDSISKTLEVTALRTIFSDSFERSSPGTDWDVSGNGVGDTGTHTAGSGSYSLYTAENEVTVTSRAIDLSAYSEGRLTAWVRRGSDNFSEYPEDGEDLQVTYLDSAGNWNQVNSYAGGGMDGQIYSLEVSLPADAFHSGFQVRFRQTDGSGTDFDYWHMDEVAVKAASPGTVIGETGRVSVVNEGWHTQQLEGSYQDPVVIMKPVSHNGGQPAHIRLRNVTGTSFEFLIEEWRYLDGNHTGETMSYVVVEKGTHQLPDGYKLDAGTVDSGLVFGDGWETVSFDSSFSKTPAVFGQIQTFNGAHPTVTRVRNVGTGDFQMVMQEEEAGEGHTTETLGYVAITRDEGTIGTASTGVARTDNTVTHNWYQVNFSTGYESNPVFLANMQTTDGGNTAHVRYRNLSGTDVEVQIEEEQSNDDETWHTTEVVGYLVMESGMFIKK